jgi:molybdopterin-guanine dinucleotide biosynthesis protein B
MVQSDVPLVGLAAYSGTGKTTLLSKIITIFRDMGIRVGVIKHAHHNFEIDLPGKDSYELRQAGATQVLIGSRRRWALIVDRLQEPELSFAEYLCNLDRNTLDIIMVEGFKPEAIPKIELNRSALNHPFLYVNDNTIIAVATDRQQPLATQLPVLDLNRPDRIAEFILERFLPDRLPGSRLTAAVPGHEQPL